GVGALLVKLRGELGPEGRYRGGYLIEPPPRELDEGMRTQDAGRNGRTYRVVYEIDLPAPSPAQAAEAAGQWLREPDSIGSVFMVLDSDGVQTTVDLYERGLDERYGEMFERQGGNETPAPRSLSPQDSEPPA
ncbi:MAG: hypothetical protein JXB13_08205, partial [Phycisphaerae bacterium]|nr:hypothetical protein [Phycisphaerae bacterium]